VINEALRDYARRRGLRRLLKLEGAYFRAAGLYRALRQSGITVRSTIDSLVAALAEENSCYVLARERDIAAILTSGLVKAGVWRLAPR
jgi:predicted nucleic acid-binding protein